MDPNTLIQAYLDDGLTDAQFAALSAWLAQSEANREAFVQAANLDSDIRRELAQGELSRFLDEVDINALQYAMQQSPEDSSAALLSITDAEINAQNPKNDLTLSRAAGVLTRAGVEFAGQRLRRHAVVLSLAAAVALAFVIVVAFIGSDNEPGQPTAQTPDQPAPHAEAPTPTTVATLTATHNAQWAKASLASGSALHSGQRLTLTAGFAEITTNDGAVAILEGPCTVELLDNDNALHLHAGKLVGICETESSKGFIVRSPHMDVIDLGTRFGVTVQPGVGVTASVFEGEVEVIESATDRTDSPRKVALAAGEQVQANTNGKLAGAVAQIQPDHGYITRWDTVQHRVDVQGQARYFIEPPANIGPDGLTAPNIIVFREKAAALDQPIDVWVDLNPTADKPTIDTLPAGTKVVSYMVHFRPGKAGGSAEATLTFPGKVLGLATKYKRLVATNRLFALDSVIYVDEANLDFNYFIDGQPGDSFEITGEEQNMLWIKLSAADHSDQARVLVEVPAD